MDANSNLRQILQEIEEAEENKDHVWMMSAMSLFGRFGMTVNDL